ncbi:mRNA splicing protein prp28 [Cryptotrichosporon argae]
MPNVPLSVDDILAEQKLERDEAAKPKFLTRAQREALALEKRNADLAAQREREKAERAERNHLDRLAEEERRKADGARYGASPSTDRYGRYERDPRDRYDSRYESRDSRDPREARYGREPPRGPGGERGGRYDRNRSPTGFSYANGSTSASPRHAGINGASNGANGASAAAEGPDVDLSALRARYLGQTTTTKKPWARKMTDKKRIFEWNADDDTSAADARALIAAGAGPVAAASPAARAGTPDRKPDNHADALERRRAGRGNNDDRHWSEKPLEDMKERDWRIFREDYSISSRGGQIPYPLRSWRESGIPKRILDIVDEIGYKEPSPIQRQAIPIGLQNRDLVGIAKTGSGKTAAFVIPMLTYISRLPALTDDNRHLGPYALIMAPTRELAQQIEAEAMRFATPLGYTCVSIVGGRSVEEQQFNLRNGAHIVIATPGRLKDMVDKSMLVLSQCRYVVMDEADRMVDLGFEADLLFILDAMPASFVKPEGELDDAAKPEDWQDYRVMTLFSATMPPAVERLTRKYLRRPATVTIGTAGEAVDTVEQRVEFVVGDEKRRARLTEILRTLGFRPPIIVFVNQKSTADMVAKYIQQAGMSAITLHSGKNQEQREAALQALRDGDVAVLVATDLAGRGIDVPDVSLVINWQMSDVIEKYIHRIGRTGRAGKRGTAITFLSNDDDEVMFDLKAEIARSPVSTMNPELARHEAARTKVTREMKRKRDDGDE